MNFRSIAQTNALIRRELTRIPGDVDLIVGIPRSGMLPAIMLAFHLNLPLTDIEGFKARKLMNGGATRGQRETEFDNLKHALIVDDSVFSGGTFEEIMRELQVGDFPKCTFCAIYDGGEYTHPELMTFETLYAPRAFEWNIMHHPFILEHACVDMDGILCFDPTPDENDAGPRYQQFLKDARRRFVPRTRIHAIVTSRLEKYRPWTEDWLERAGITYDQLHMLDLPDEETRKRLGQHAVFKAAIYQSTDDYVFIESEAWQAREIARITGRPALCLNDEPEIFYGTMTNPRGALWHLKKNPTIRRLLHKTR